MKTLATAHFRIALLALLTGACLLNPLPSGHAAAGLKWDRKSNRVDADLQDLPLSQLLERVAQVTGWEVYVEPDVAYRITTRFQGQTTGEALRLLLGRSNYALLPRTNGPAKLFVFQSSLGEATQRIRPAQEPDLEEQGRGIPDELVVTLRPGGDIDALARRFGAKVTGRSDALNLFRLKFDNEDAAASARDDLLKEPSVSAVDSNYAIPRPPAAEPVTLSSPMPLSLKPKVSGDANRLIIGLIDTPVQRQVSGFDEFLLPAVSIAGSTAQTPADHPTHGTSMFSTILRGLEMGTTDSNGSPVRVLPVDVYGNHEMTSTFDVALGINAAIKSGATIINLSLGAPLDAPYLRTLIANTQNQGLLYVAAAGNEPVTRPTYPAAYPEVLAVTAGDRRGNVASYANRGDFVDVVAPGAAVVPFGDRTFLSYGTSASTAYVSGLAAGMAAGQKRPLSQVEADLRRTLAFKPPTSN